MDQFLESLSEVSKLLLPIAGLVVLVVLILILINVLKAVKKLPDTLNNVDTILNGVNSSIDKLQGPLDTVSSVSKSVDTANNALNTVIGFASQQIIKNYALIKDIIVGFFSKENDTPKEADDLNTTGTDSGE